MGITIAQFIEEVEPIGKVRVKGLKDKAARNYDVFNPNDLEERHYIAYFAARAMSMDIVARYTKVEMVNGTPVTLPSDNPGDVLRMESELHVPARKMVCALLQVSEKELNLRPKTLIRVYNAIEEMLKEADVPEPDEVEIINDNTSESESKGEPAEEKKD